jgi:hypothetical protein
MGRSYYLHLNCFECGGRSCNISYRQWFGMHCDSCKERPEFGGNDYEEPEGYPVLVPGNILETIKELVDSMKRKPDCVPILVPAKYVGRIEEEIKKLQDNEDYAKKLYE